MKAKTFTAAIAITSLLTLGGSAFAAADPADGYNRAFLGKTTTQSDTSDSMGKAAYGTQSEPAAWYGHDAYNRALLGKVASKPDTMGKAAYGTVSGSSIDGVAAYHGAFRGD